MNLHNVFIYGTLKSGHSNHADLTESEGTHRLLGAGETVYAFPLIVGTSLNVPVLLCARGQGSPVLGEVYEVDNAKLAHLDKIMRHPDFFERQSDQCRLLHSDEIVDVWVYVMPRWAHDFMAKSSAPLREYRDNEEGRGVLQDERAHESIPNDENKAHHIDSHESITKDVPQLHRVFVYCSLQKGQALHHVLTESEGLLRACGPARSVERFPRIVATQLNIPLVLAKKGEGEHILGEIYEIDDRKLAVLDGFETRPVNSERKLEKFKMEVTGVTTEAWIYVIHSEPPSSPTPVKQMRKGQKREKRKKRVWR